VLFKKYGLKKKYYSSISSEDFEGITSPLNIYDALDSETELLKNDEFNTLDNQSKVALKSWSKDGYAILENFFSPEEVESCNTEINNLLENNTLKFEYSNKIMFAFHKSKLIQEMGENKKLKKILNLLMGKQVGLFQSINFIEGSQQKSHSDSIHMTTFPYGNLIAVWVALEDISADAGPLHYYPGSHKLPYIMNRDFDNIGTKYKLGDKKYGDYEDYMTTFIAQQDLDKKVFLAKKGDLLIWHANLLHGGEEVTKANATRKSMVFHYYSDDAICFHETTQRPTLKKS
jgi:ectoine hydroxylase-related dioxygenase (phytanoyl-CoA dioxygenase family)